MQRNINGSPFAYESHGEGLPIVFLHGLPTDRRSMVPRFEPLFSAKSSWRRIYADLPGAGETPGRAAIVDFGGYVAEVAEFIEQETAGQRVTIVGASYGAYFAAAYAQKHPERVAGLALLVPFFGQEEPVLPPRKIVVTEPGVLDGANPRIVGMMNAAATVHTRRVREIFERDIAPGGQVADHAFLNRVLATRQSYQGGDTRTLRTDAPTLIVTGRQDSMDGYAEAWELGQRLPRATYAVLDRAGHALMGEQNELLLAHVREWLARVNEGLGKPYEEPGL